MTRSLLEPEPHQRRRERDRERAEAQPALGLAATPGVGHDAADQQTQDSGERDQHPDEAGLADVEAVVAHQERREKAAERVHREVVERARSDDPEQRRSRQDQAVGRARAAAGSRQVGLGGAPRRIAHEQHRDGAGDPGQRRQVERGAPAQRARQQAAEREAEREAQRQAEHEDRHRARATLRREQVADQRRRGRRAAGFARRPRRAGTRTAPRSCAPGRWPP